jgi:hypothetical protein
MIISPKAIDALKRNYKLKGLVAIAHGCTVQTIERWIRKKSIKHLTAAAVLHMDIIKEHTGFNTDDILVA